MGMKSNGGKENHIQCYGMPMNQNLNKIKDPIERDFAFKSMQITPYCSFCGGEILAASVDKDNTSVNWEWEIQNKAHYSCYSEYQAQLKIHNEVSPKKKLIGTHT